MRKAQKEQALGFITLLEQAHDEIKANIRKGNLEPVLVTLADCQDGAIALGDLIEAYEGEGFVTISFLEKYCEVVYEIYQSIAGGENADANKIDKALRKALIAVGNSVRNDIKVRMEVVFFPYKASMWDALESVYRAAKKDPDCDAYCVPIPYYDKNPDGSFKTMHYEGRDFPTDIEVIDWKSYKVEERRPDMIFIHNPYDEYNFVTSVHPSFYSSRIKEYTDTLVYIPYFVHQNDSVQEHYCTMPGVIYADKVILQSEKVREQYVRYFSAEYPDLVKNMGKDALRDKFLALGSPKFDVIPTAKDSIPEEWKPYLADGKKVVFLNTHLRSIMRGNSERFLKKLEWVFDYFEKREDVVLLWRPHPLMVNTAQAMNPAAVQPYLQLVKKYQERKIGIYDDSKDLHRAINLSDIYYGDASSVAELFRQQGKAVMLMNHSIIGD